MKTHSDTLPDTFIDLGGRFYFNFNVVENSSGGYSFDAVEISDKSKPSIVQSLIREKYSYADEIALINNFNAGFGIDEYNSYQDYRAWAKQLADEKLFQV